MTMRVVVGTICYIILLMSLRYQTAYKQQTYSTDIFTEEPRCCKSKDLYMIHVQAINVLHNDHHLLNVSLYAHS